jgi:hypothetical protein
MGIPVVTDETMKPGDWKLEQSHSNPLDIPALVQRLRGFGLERIGLPATLLEQAAAALEAQAADLSKLKADWESIYGLRWETYSDMKAWRDRLRAELHRTGDTYVQNARLRAALEQARSATFGTKDDLLKLHDVGDICEQALAGLPVEKIASRWYAEPSWAIEDLPCDNCGAAAKAHLEPLYLCPGASEETS